MKKNILGVVLVVAGLTSAGVIYSASKRDVARTKQNDNQGTYKERLQRAKTRGEKKIRSRGVIPIYAQIDLDGALAIYDLLVGEFVSSKSFATNDDGDIVTWYKFKIHETLSKAKQRVTSIESPPAELLPLANDEILVWKMGGSVEIDGMQVEMEEVGFPPFENSKRYLLVVAVDHDKQAGIVEVGPSGALTIKSDDTLESISKNRTFFKTEIENRYGTSVTRLKEKLK